MDALTDMIAKAVGALIPPTKPSTQAISVASLVAISERRTLMSPKRTTIAKTISINPPKKPSVMDFLGDFRPLTKQINGLSQSTADSSHIIKHKTRTKYTKDDSVR